MCGPAGQVPSAAGDGRLKGTKTIPVGHAVPAVGKPSEASPCGGPPTVHAPEHHTRNSIHSYNMFASPTLPSSTTVLHWSVPSTILPAIPSAATSSPAGYSMCCLLQHPVSTTIASIHCVSPPSTSSFNKCYSTIISALINPPPSHWCSHPE